MRLYLAHYNYMWLTVVKPRSTFTNYRVSYRREEVPATTVKCYYCCY